MRKQNESKPLRIGQVQLEIMKVLWERGEATAREITDALSAQKPIAHSTVQTLLRNLMAKGAVEHEKKDRTFAFRPLIQKDEVLSSSLQDVLRRMFHGSTYDLVSHLLKEEKVGQAELQRLKELIEKHAQDGEKK